MTYNFSAKIRINQTGPIAQISPTT